MKKIFLSLFAFCFVFMFFANAQKIDQKLIDKNIKLLQSSSIENTIRNNFYLKQWNYNATFLKWDWTNDKIKIVVNGKKTTIPLAYNYTNKKVLKSKEYKNCLSKFKVNQCKDMFFTKMQYMLQFSPSWYYLLYSVWWWEFGRAYLVDVTNWKTMIKINWTPIKYQRTNDKKQFVYATDAGMWSAGGLYVTIRGKFPNTKTLIGIDNISKKRVLGWRPSDFTIDDKYIYALIQADDWEYVYIYDLYTYSLVQKQLIKN